MFTRPYRPRTNGKAERFIQTMLREWAYAAVYRTSDHRAEHSNPGSTSTITADPTAPSITKPQQAAYPRQPEQPGWELHLDHLMSLMMLNIGRYSEITMPPTAAPMTTIKRGSMSDVNASTVASTSWS